MYGEQEKKGAGFGHERWRDCTDMQVINPWLSGPTTELGS